MRLVVEGEPREIAALLREITERQDEWEKIKADIIKLGQRKVDYSS